MGRAWIHCGLVLIVGISLIVVQLAPGEAQEKIRIAYSSTDTLNSIWTVADDAGFYKKHGLDAEGRLHRQYDRWRCRHRIPRRAGW